MPDKFSIGVGNFTRARQRPLCLPPAGQQICKPVIGFGESVLPTRSGVTGNLAGEQRVVDSNLKGEDEPGSLAQGHPGTT